MERIERGTAIAILVAALGYFVDIFDIYLFTLVRSTSLTELGLTGTEITDTGVFLLNMQMFGMLVGGVIFGILGDKRGRLSVLFGSIFLYSVANLANAFVYDIPGYALLRFISGVGLAGELGGGITLVSEMMPKASRGYATTIIAAVGVTGVLAAALVGDLVHWRTAYFIGGVLGLGLLALRVAVTESGLYSSLSKEAGVRRGDIRMLFTSKDRFLRYLSCIAIGIPIWFAIGILVTFCPEIGVALGMTGPVKVTSAVIYYSVGITLGDIGSGVLSQLARSRRRVIFIFQLISAASITLLLLSHGASPDYYYSLVFMMGFGIGYWAVFVTTAAEQFGTNLRSTVTTTVPNFVRGSTVLATSLFVALKGNYGVVGAAQVVGILWFLIAFAALAYLKESYGRDLDFLER